MSEPSYFDDPQNADKLRAEALSWLGTPFRPAFKSEPRPGIPAPTGRPGATDCVGLVEQVFAGIGAAPEFLFPRNMADYQSHQTGDKILDYFRGKIDDPQSKQLAAMFVELSIPDMFKDPDAESPQDFFKTGDILAARHGSLFHLMVLVDDQLHFVSAIPRMGVIEGTIQDATYRRHLVAAFRLKPK